MAFTLPPLPYQHDELKPHISAETIEYHYGKHHQAYVNNLNTLIQDTPQATMSLEEIIKSSTGPLFNNAAQVWNHTFYWYCLSPHGGGQPQDPLHHKLQAAFGSFDAFKEAFSKAAITTFGSGWAWLVMDETNQLKILTTANANTPMTQGHRALLTCDVWEHAYYLDYRHQRAHYIQAFWELVNWHFVVDQLL